MIDELLNWCEQNQIYLILDMHAAPGGQGYDAAISDYDSSKPSLWESIYNRNKLIALWGKLAERYQNETWIGGYDLLNEPNWNLQDTLLEFFSGRFDISFPQVLHFVGVVLFGQVAIGFFDLGGIHFF